MKNEPFVIERTYNAPVERVWKAITEKEAMKHWYFDIAEFEPKVGFEFSFEGKSNEGFVYNHLCRITEVIPQKKLQHTWEYEGHEGSTLVTIELFAEGDKTRLKLTHEGLETLPNLPAFAKGNFAEGWTVIIGSHLSDYVEEETLYKSIEVDATPEIAWEVFSNADNVKVWANAFFEGTYAESDFKLNSTVLWKTSDGTTMVKGVVTELDKPRLLDITYYDDPSHSAPTPLGRYHERYRTSTANGITVIEIESGPLARTWTKMHAPMWDKALELMKEVAEK